LIGILYSCRQCSDGVRAEEPAVGIDIGWIRVPLFPSNRIGIENRPYRSAAVCLSIVREFPLVPRPADRNLYELSISFQNR
jgi:hypothetical protein